MVKDNIFLCTIVSAFTVALLINATESFDNSAQATTQTNANSTMATVQAGGGNASMSLSSFSPQIVEINTGDSVKWINPTKVPEPHTITFVLSNESYPELLSPFAIDNSTQFMPVPTNTNSEPTIVPQGPNGTKLIIALNDRAFNPFVIDAENNIQRLDANANYDMKGSEKYVNSGTITPQGLTPPAWPPINEFTVKFEQPGTYDYVCIFHPWMTGSVVVK